MSLVTTKFEKDYGPSYTFWKRQKGINWVDNIDFFLQSMIGSTFIYAIQLWVKKRGFFENIFWLHGIDKVCRLDIFRHLNVQQKSRNNHHLLALLRLILLTLI